MTQSLDGRHLLTSHRDIQDWAARHNGLPAMHAARNRLGDLHAELSLRFHGPAAPGGMPSLDDGAAPCSWTAWLAELDRQQLAVRVPDPAAASYELVKRNEQTH